MLKAGRTISAATCAGIFLISSSPCFGQDQTVQNQAPVITKKIGEPVTIHLSNGNIVELKQVETLIPLESTVVLSENSCSSKLGLKWGFVVPVVVRSLVPVWKAHPTKQGQPITRFDSTDKKDVVTSQTSLQSRNNGSSLFESDLARLTHQDPHVQRVKKIALENPSAVGWFDCKDSCNDVLPKGATVALLWDENFEMANDEISMSRSSDPPAVNQMTNRFGGIPLKVNGGRIEFGRPRKGYGIFSNFLPMGVTYQIQLSFQAPNLVEPDDHLCQMKWDVDFTSIFTKFTQATEQVEDPEKIKSVDLKEYMFRAEDEENATLNSMFSESNYRGEEYGQ
ncbi:MAG: hypothetical protein AB7G93_01015 [Bdellovibrionales bacterium]